MTTQTATVTKPAKAKGALKKAQMTAEAAAAAIKLVPSPELVAAVEAEQAEAVVIDVAEPQMDGADAMTAKTVAKAKAPKVAKAAAQADTYTMTGVYHVFKKAWAAGGGKRVAFTPDEIHALLVADGGNTK